MRPVIGWTAVLAFFPIALAAQQTSQAPVGTAVLYGSVLSDPHDTPVSGAEIVVMPGLGARTDAKGDFIIAGIAPGSYNVVVRHLGHTAINNTLAFASGDSLGRDFVLVPEATRLDTVNVAGWVPLRSPGFLGIMTGYADRRIQRIGVAVDSAMLTDESYRRLGDIIRTHLPVHVMDMNGSASVASSRGMVSSLNRQGRPSGDAADQRRGAKGACYTQVYIDGVRVYAPAPDVPLFDINSISPSTLQAVEFFSGPATTPTVYGGTGASCGTLLLWTK
ncbi:MAG: carboxypeptidase regulatory-like domain-containing protein [Gemmatimonadaceae bacterium]